MFHNLTVKSFTEVKGKIHTDSIIARILPRNSYDSCQFFIVSNVLLYFMIMLTFGYVMEGLQIHVCRQVSGAPAILQLARWTGSVIE